jgi:hypothetical protein
MKMALLAMLVVAAGVVALAGCGDSTDNRAGGGALPDDRTLEPAPIDELEMIIRESAPPQYAVRIVSGLPNGCAEFEEAVIVARSSQAVAIRVLNRMPADPNVVCTAVYGMHESIVELGSDFTPGVEYTLDVNDDGLKFTAE